MTLPVGLTAVLVYFYRTFYRSALLRNQQAIRETHASITCCFQNDSYIKVQIEQTKRTTVRPHVTEMVKEEQLSLL